MALNWDAFIDTESLNLFDDQWSDLLAPPPPPPPPPGHSTPQMPKSVSTDNPGSTLFTVTNIESLLNGASGNSYLDESLFTSNDYFLNDLEVLQPFTLGGGKSTTEASPKPTSTITDNSTQAPVSLLNGLSQTPQMSLAQKQAIQRGNTFPNPAYESLFSNIIDSAFVEDLTFPNEPKVSSTTSKLDLVKHQSSVSAASKRNKNKPDILSACWTSPLCPNQNLDGPPPNPSTCGGDCAPFLFANDDLPVPTMNNLLADPQDVFAEEGIVEIRSRPRKRSESDVSSNELSGRDFSTNNAITFPTDPRKRPKSKTSEQPPAKELSHSNTDDKSTSRRRLPHNQVERKYRESLNTQLDSLQRVVPSLQQEQRAYDGADIEDLPTPSKPSKAVILASATAYIKQMEKDKKSLADENKLLRTRVRALQALVKCDDCSLMQYVMDLKIEPAS